MSASSETRPISTRGGIQILPPELANRIAAGEVVERPASVVRELIDNAIDAGATRVDVEVRDGGLKLIRVADNGCGMAPEDVRLCVKRHATSKIRTPHDLDAIATKGFRGEALAAIASVSRFEVVSRRADDDLAARMTVEGGLEQEPGMTGAPVGTTVTVADLFFNTPARRKFLKKPATELGHLIAQVNYHALAHENIHFTFTNNQSRSIDLPAAPNRPARIQQIFNADILDELIPVQFDSPILSISGLVSRPTLNRNGAQHLFFFVNDRFIKDRLLHRAVMNGYRNLIPHGRYPVVFLFLEIPPDEIDVNVHPTKQEIKFSREDAVFSAVYGAIRQAWDKREEARREVDGIFSELGGQASPPAQNARPAAPPVQPPQQTNAPSEAHGAYTPQPGVSAPPDESETAPREAVQPSAPAAEPPYAKRPVNAPPTHETPDGAPTLNESPEATRGEIERLNRQPLGAPGVSPAPSAAPQGDGFSDLGRVTKKLDDLFSAESLEGVEPLIVVGQLLDCYILAESKKGLYIIDQHAAHERLMFEKFLVQSQKASLASQAMLFPLTLDVTTDEAVLLEEQQEVLNRLGFEIEPFGPQTFVLRAMPAHVDAGQAETFIKDLLGEIRHEGSAAEKQERALHTMACRAAVKFGDRLTPEEMTGIVRGLESIPRRNVCPHGRPAVLYVGDGDLRRLFKRTGFD
ncbi:MAG: DNA mismatch repair endonuclease MutL [bacterium]|nr:DNA mismatch repair endonuclease MutL [bacterium]